MNEVIGLWRAMRWRERIAFVVAVPVVWHLVSSGNADACAQGLECFGGRG